MVRPPHHMTAAEKSRANNRVGPAAGFATFL
jgi:hypothetical protein